MDDWFNVRIKPMLASLSSEPFDSPSHIYEAKWEGVRCLAFLRPDGIRLQNRRLVDITTRYPELLRLSQAISNQSAVLDGVLLVLENGRPSSARSLQREYATDPAQVRRLSSQWPAVLVVFDVLFLNGDSAMGRPLLARKELLRAIARPSTQLVVGTWMEDKGTTLLNQVSRLGVSGVVAKEKHSVYEPGLRSTSWLKMQRFKLQDCLICGYTDGQGRREGLLGSLVLGVYYKGELVHIGQVGSGYDHQTLRDLHAQLTSLQTSICPFAREPQIERSTTWIQPKLICEVQYAEWTADCKLRSPRYVRLRANKRREDCQIEEVCRGPESELEPVGPRLLG